MDKNNNNSKPTRRDFIYTLTATLGVLGAGASVWPIVSQMNPDSSVKALSTVEVDISKVEEGKEITVMWRGKPIFIRHRTANEINDANNVSVGELKHMASDESRVKNPKWLVVIGVCTHLGCVPLGQKIGDNKGEYGGWFCPCHGSHYDTSGRVRKGPAPLNLEVPPYEFVSDDIIKIG